MNSRQLTVLLGVVVLGFPAARAENKPEKWDETPLMWRDPGNIASRDLFYGAGGRNRQPRGRFTFVEEDREGFNPKFVGSPRITELSNILPSFDQPE